MILDQLFNPASLKEGTVYDLGREYGAPAPEKKQKSQDPGDHNPYPFSPEEDDDYFREIFRKKREAAKQQGVAEDTTDMPFGSVTQPNQTQTYTSPSRQDIWDKNDLVNRQAEAREQKQLTLRYARKHGRQAMENLWAERTDVRMTVEEILEFLDATVNDPGLTPEEFMGTKGLDEGSGQDSKSWMASIKQQHPTVKFVQAKMPGAPIMAMVNGKPVAQWDGKTGVDEGVPITTTPDSIDPGGATDNFKQQMANNTEIAYQKKLAGVAEGNKKPEADYGDDYQQMVLRLKKLAGAGPLKTQYDPQKRVYRNMPTAQQPKK
jgi:hypothetical protein